MPIRGLRAGAYKENYPDVKIIAISGGGMIDPDSYLCLAEKMGATRTLTKPFQREEFLEIVNDLLSQ
jgi:DNA-binding NtrC family response regulator